MTRDDQQRIVFALCQRKDFAKLSARLKASYDRGLAGMAAAYRKTSNEFAAWKAGRMEFEHMAAIRSREPTRE